MNVMTSIYLLLAILDGNVHQLRILGLLRSREDKRWVGGGILRLVFCDCCIRYFTVLTSMGWVCSLAKSPESQTTVCHNVSYAFVIGVELSVRCQWL